MFTDTGQHANSRSHAGRNTGGIRTFRSISVFPGYLRLLKVKVGGHADIDIDFQSTFGHEPGSKDFIVPLSPQQPLYGTFAIYMYRIYNSRCGLASFFYTRV
jgi:hypothetical protein